jgi:hypothetical protein
MAREKNQTMKGLSQEIEILREQVKEIEPLKQKVIELLGIVKTLTIKENIKEVIITRENIQEKFKCKECEMALVTKKQFKEHGLKRHPKILCCVDCEKVFTKNCELEVHIKIFMNQSRTMVVSCAIKRLC